MENKFNSKQSISIRADEKMSKMIEELKEALLLNTTSIIKLALVNFYEQQKAKTTINNGDD